MGRNDKVASATVTTPLPNSPLCDDTWQAYIFALDLDEDGQNAKKWNSFYDLVANGTRQRFSVLSKAAALAWAGENAKNYDTCKEVKAILDSGGAQAEIPDALLARLVKMKLLALKLEGIEQRNAAKVAKETAETSAPVPEPADAAKGKPAKKDDKEKEKEKEKEKASEKDRAKSSNKKVTKGASNKQQEAPSRPESARAAPETSLRKNKLRDRGVVKTDTKPTAIGDEPENGPDAYYLLRDFPTPGFYTCLMDENGVQLNLFLTLDDSNGSEGQRPGDGGSPDSGVGSRRGSAWPVARAAPESSLWKNVPFRSIATSNLPEDTDVFDVAAKEIYKLLEVRNIYESFYSNDRIISIPELEETKLYSSLRYFDYLMTSVPSEPMINSDVLLALMLEQVARMAPSKGEEGGSPGVVLPAKAEEIQALKRYFETASSNLIPTREEGEGKDVMVDDQSTARPVCSWADSHAAITSLMRPAPNEEFHISAALADLRKNFTAGRLMSAIRRLNETGVMNPGAAVRDQLVWASRIQSVKGATIQDTEEANRLLRQKEFETLLSESKASSITSLRDWTCIESLDEDAFAQVLETTRVTYPVTRIRYSDRENGVLIALTGPGAAGALEANRHSTFQARTKVGFGLFAQLHQSQPKLLQHETATSSPYVYSVGDRVLEFEESNHYVYPTAEGYIKHERLRAREGTTDTCLSIHWDSGMLSWRRGKSNGKTELIASFNDGSVMSFISEGPGSSATVHVSTPDGQTVAWDAQGGITQKLNAARKRSFSKGSFGEFGRHIRPDGTVIKYLQNGETRILFPDGSVSIQGLAGDWTSTRNDGSRVITKPSDDNQPQHTHTSIKVCEEKDMVTGRSIITRQDMVTIVKSDEELVIKHALGTAITVTGSVAGQQGVVQAKKINVKADGFAVITLDIFARRSVIDLTNGAVIERIEDQGGEKITFRLQKGEDIVTISTDGTATLSSAESNLSRVGTTYDMNWAEGSIASTDKAGNVFHVDATKPVSITKSEAREGEHSKYITNKKIVLRESADKISNAPRLFVLRTSGEGSQFLRDSDVAAFFQEQAQKPHVRITEEGLVGRPSSRAVSFIIDGDAAAEPQTRSRNFVHKVIRHRQITRHAHPNEALDPSLLAHLEESSTSASASEKPDPRSSIYNNTSARTSSTNRTGVLGLDRKETEELIKRKYALEEKDIIPSASADDANTQAVGKTKVKTKGRTLHRIIQDEELPNYFRSPEYEEIKGSAAEAANVPAEQVLPEAEGLKNKEPTASEPRPSSSKETKRKAEVKSEPHQTEIFEARQSKPQPGSPLRRDVLGRPRKGKVGLPSVLKSSKGPAVSNSKYLEAELEAGRQVRTASTAVLRAKDKEALINLGIFEIHPTRIHFGPFTADASPIPEMTLTLLNVGNNSARFKVKQVADTCLVLTYKKGPVAPGMKAEIKVRPSPKTLSIETESVRIKETLQITTEAHIFTIDCTGEIRRGIGQTEE